MADESSPGIRGYRIEHHHAQGTVVVQLLVNPDPLAISNLVDQICAVEEPIPRPLQGAPPRAKETGEGRRRGGPLPVRPIEFRSYETGPWSRP